MQANKIPKCPKCDSEGEVFQTYPTGDHLYKCKKCQWRYKSNSKIEQENPKCPKCDSESFEFDLSSTGRILYRCKNSKCQWRFNNINSTSLKGSRLSDSQLENLYQLIYKKGWQLSQISREIGITRRTVYRYKKLWDSERKEKT